MKKLKLGILGLSEGNGHPYSWSAIFNGYNTKAMASCPFPVIPAYLAKESFPEAAIPHATVTHIWTQDKSTSEHIAKAPRITEVVEKSEDMIPHVDGILLARDDAAHHLSMAKPFLEAGLPIYIDKPLALNRKEAALLFSLQQYPGQLFTCSAFQYARELKPVEDLKNIHHIDAYIKNDWYKYAIHLIEPIVKIIGAHRRLEHSHRIEKKTHTIAHYSFCDDLTVQIKTFNQLPTPPTLHLFHEKGTTTIIFQDTFYAFKNALLHFIKSIQEKREITQKDFVLRCIEMLEA